ncbi:MAG: hypothetical protein ACI837_001831 [Crocinitomicaceae bacterium]|jgi:hypothetical protein
MYSLKAQPKDVFFSLMCVARRISRQTNLGDNKAEIQFISRHLSSNRGVIMKEKISAFWKWFVDNEQIIKDCLEDEASEDRVYVSDQLNELILDLGTFTWDIGLNDSNEWFLIISPNGNNERHKVSQKIIHAAPYELNWTLHSSKPAKNWDRKFKVYNSELDEVDVDAADWEYIAFDEDDGRVELIIEAKNIRLFDIDTAESAANVFVVNELGEYAKMQRVSKVSIVEAVEEEYADTKTAIRHLRRDLGV